MTLATLIFSAVAFLSLAVYIAFRIKCEFEIETEKTGRRVAFSFTIGAILLYILPLFLETYRFGGDILQQSAAEILGRFCGSVVVGLFLGALKGAFPAVIAISASMVVASRRSPGVSLRYADLPGVDAAVTAVLTISWWATAVRSFTAMIGMSDWSVLAFL